MYSLIFYINILGRRCVSGSNGAPHACSVSGAAAAAAAVRWKRLRRSRKLSRTDITDVLRWRLFEKPYCIMTFHLSRYYFYTILYLLKKFTFSTNCVSTMYK